MGQIMTKKRRSLDDNSLDLFMRISHTKENLTTKDTTQVMDIWSGLSVRWIFSDKLWITYKKHYRRNILSISIFKPFLFVAIFYLEMFIYKVKFYYKYTIFLYNNSFHKNYEVRNRRKNHFWKLHKNSRLNPNYKILLKNGVV